MVKGVTRRVIVVKSPDPRFFEQAIFIMREEAFSQEGVTADAVVQEARRVAAGYVRRNAGPARWLCRIPAPLYAAAGALAVTAAWGITLLL